MWDASRCDGCGICLERCHYCDYDRAEGGRQIKLLSQGHEAGILKKCVTCCACTEFCPQGADPFDLIVGMMEKHHTFPVNPDMVTIFDHLRDIPSAITLGDPDKPVLSLCVMEASLPPGMLGSKLFEGLTIARGGDYFCLIGYVHLGLRTPLAKHAAAFLNSLTALKRDIVFLHDDCYAMVHAKLKEFGLRAPFGYRHIFEYLRDYLRDNRSLITPLDRAVAYQRPCASRYTPHKDAFLDEIFELTGVRRVERRYDRENALCCSASFLRVYPEQGRAFQALNIEDALTSGAEALITLCPMCDRALKRPCDAAGLAKINIIDLCRMAIGEIPAPF
jgi:Fe-S oxidoreductase